MYFKNLIDVIYDFLVENSGIKIGDGDGFEDADSINEYIAEMYFNSDVIDNLIHIFNMDAFKYYIVDAKNNGCIIDGCNITDFIKYKYFFLRRIQNLSSKRKKKLTKCIDKYLRDYVRFD